jgi:phosphohistidine phosphatase
MKKTLILVRHAAAEDQTLMIRDYQRELVGKGRADALVVGKWLASTNLLPEKIVTSSAPRAYQTAVIIADQIKFDTLSIVKSDSLYDGGARAYLGVVNGLDETVGIVAVFGHNPDISYFAEYLSGANIGGSMPKCAVVVIQFDDLKWEEVSSKSGKFIVYTTPRELREM